MRREDLSPFADLAEPSTPAQIEAAVSALGIVALPLPYKELLLIANGLQQFEQGEAHLYSTAEVAERNATYEVRAYAPDLLLIGDDGGGRGFFITQDDECEVMLIGLGAIGSIRPEMLGSFSEWLSAGMPYE